MTKRRWLLVVVGGVLLLLAGRSMSTHLPALVSHVESRGAWGPLLFVGGYAIASAAFVPAGLLTLSAGAIFGLTGGAVYAFLGATLGACLAFALARYVMRDLVDGWLATAPRAAAVASGVGANGRRIAFLLRLSPIIPFSMINLAMGASRISFIDFLIGCAGMLPVTILYTYYGALAGTLAGALGHTDHGAALRSPAHAAVLVLGLIVTLAVTIVVSRVAGRALRAEAPGAR